MSTTAALALISATFLTGGFYFFYLMKLTVDLGHQIVTGLVRGVPISINYRWLLFYSVWVFYILGAVVAGIVLALVNVKIAHYATDPGVRPVAYLVAFVFGIGTGTVALTGLTAFLHHRSTLRESQRD